MLPIPPVKIPWQIWAVGITAGILFFFIREFVSIRVENAVNANNAEVTLQYAERIKQLQADKDELRISLEKLSEVSNEVIVETIETIREVRVEVEVPTECTDLGSDFLQQYQSQIRAAAGD